MDVICIKDLAANFRRSRTPAKGNTQSPAKLRSEASLGRRGTAIGFGQVLDDHHLLLGPGEVEVRLPDVETSSERRGVHSFDYPEIDLNHSLSVLPFFGWQKINFTSPLF